MVQQITALWSHLNRVTEKPGNIAEASACRGLPSSTDIMTSRCVIVD